MDADLWCTVLSQINGCCASGAGLKLLSFVNWAVLTAAVIATLAGAVLCLLAWPFSDAGASSDGFAAICTGTELGLGVAVFAALATWLVDKRDPRFWLAELALLVAAAAALVYGFGHH